MDIMLDCIGAAVPMVKGLVPNPDVVAWYGTGTPEIQWTDADKNYWPNVPKIEIDQGFNSPPITTAQVRDVENGAWTIPAALDLANWHHSRPTIYGSRNTISSIVGKWKGDIWIAIPGWQPGDSVPNYSGMKTVAIQAVYTANFDTSFIIDSTWVFPQPTGEKEMINGLNTMGEDDFVPFPTGSFKRIQFYVDFNDATVRCAVHSVAHGYSQIETVNATGHVPVTVAFTESDVDGVSISNATNTVGWTLS